MQTPAREKLGVAGLLSVLVFLAYAAIALATAIQKPIANWDMLAYQASVLDRGAETNAAALHRETYARVKAITTENQFRELTESDAWRQRQVRDPEAFRSMLPMYQVKGGYIALLRAASSVTDTIRAARLISFVSVAFMLVCLAWAFWRLGALHYLGLMTPVLAVLRFPDLASMVAPDPLSTALAVAALSVIAARGTIMPGPLPVALIALSVWIRPDMLVVAAGLPFALAAAAILDAWRSGVSWVRAVSAPGIWPWLALPLAFGAYQLAKWGVVHPGWWPHFNFSIIGLQETMAGFNPEFSWSAYGQGVMRGKLRLARDEIWPWLMLAMLLAAWLRMDWRKTPAAALALAFVAVGSVAARMVVFPLGDSRLAVLPLVALLLAGAVAASVREPRPQV
ncbi:MAG: hypothetical protein ACRCTI_13045 [Beijerinckiaceae bacterium]